MNKTPDRKKFCASRLTESILWKLSIPKIIFRFSAIFFQNSNVILHRTRKKCPRFHMIIQREAITVLSRKNSATQFMKHDLRQQGHKWQRQHVSGTKKTCKQFGRTTNAQTILHWCGHLIFVKNVIYFCQKWHIKCLILVRGGDRERQREGRRRKEGREKWRKERRKRRKEGKGKEELRGKFLPLNEDFFF